MRRQRRRPRYYYASSLFDGTVLAAYPIRKPAPKIIKRDNLKIDEDGVCGESLRAGKHLSDCQYESRGSRKMLCQNISILKTNEHSGAEANCTCIHGGYDSVFASKQE
jgi:hypothetical protein